MTDSRFSSARAGPVKMPSRRHYEDNCVDSKMQQERDGKYLVEIGIVSSCMATLNSKHDDSNEHQDVSDKDAKARSQDGEDTRNASEASDSTASTRNAGSTGAKGSSRRSSKSSARTIINPDSLTKGESDGTNEENEGCLPVLQVNDKPIDLACLDEHTTLPPPKPRVRNTFLPSFGLQAVGPALPDSLGTPGVEQVYEPQSVPLQSQSSNLPVSSSSCIHWFKVPTAVRAQPSTPMTGEKLLAVATPLIRWRLLTFYNSFFPAYLHSTLAAEAYTCLHQASALIHSLDLPTLWDKFDAEQRYLGRRRSSLFTKCINSSLAGLCFGKKPIQAPDALGITSTVSSACKALKVSPNILLTALESYASAHRLQPHQQSANPASPNNTAASLADKKMYPYLARILLSDLDFLTSSSNKISTSQWQLTIGADTTIDLTSIVIDAVKKAKYQYFDAVSWDTKRCGCGCKRRVMMKEETGKTWVGDSPYRLEGHGRSEKRVYYRLNEKAEE